MVSIFLFYLYIQCTSATNNTKRTNNTSLAHIDGPECKKAKNENDIFFTITLNVNGVQQEVEYYAKVIPCDDPDTYKYSIRSNNIICMEYRVPIAQEVLLKAQIVIENDEIDARFDFPKEIFNNHLQQQTNEIEPDIKQKIETSKNIKKNAINFMKLTEDGKMPRFQIVPRNEIKYEQIKKIPKNLKDKTLYTLKSFMEQNVIETFNLSKYMPEYITKYACNKEIFDKQTEAIRTIFITGVIDFDEFFGVLDKEIDYDDDDKEMLANLIDIQMNDFLRKNINSLTLLFPKMQFFMEYYDKYQDDLVFFEDTKHVCMVCEMMHILETILKCTEHLVNEIKSINSDFIECSNGNNIYRGYKKNPTILYYLATKFEIEKMLLYILQSFLPTDHFIDLVDLFHFEFMCSFGIFRYIDCDLSLQKPNKSDGIMSVLSTYCYMCIDTLETDTNGTQKKVTMTFFRHYMKKNI